MALAHLRTKQDLSSRQARGTALASLTALLGLTVAVLVRARFVFIDDSYITFRYARNFARIGELVFNAGERVEGFTNLLWTLILAAQFAVVDVPVEPFALGVSLVLLFFTIIRVWHVTRVLGGTTWLAFAVGALIVLNPAAIAISTGGLETPLYSALLAEAAFRVAVGQLGVASSVAGFLFMTRPEGAFFFAPILAIGLYTTRRWQSVAAAVWPGFGIVLGVTAFRLAYFGHPLPNSVVAKSFPLAMAISLRSLTLDYIAGFWRESPAFMLIGVAVPVAVLLPMRRDGLLLLRNQVLLFCASGIAFSFVVAARNGGDWMPHHRLLLQYAPLYAVAAACLLLSVRGASILAGMLLLAPALQTAKVAARNPTRLPGVEADWSPFGAQVVSRLRGHLRPDDVVSSETLGYVGYQLPDTRFHDPTGLIDEHLARFGKPAAQYGKMDVTYTLDVVRPAVAVWHWANHLRDVPASVLEGYRAYCAAECASGAADVVMIRRDRVDDLETFFNDWPVIELPLAPTTTDR